MILWLPNNYWLIKNVTYWIQQCTNKVRWLYNTKSTGLQVRPGSVPIKACWLGECIVVHLQSSFSSASSSVVSISSSSPSLGGSSLLPNIAGVSGQVHTFNASARLVVPAGDPNDMGLLEHELHSDLLWPWPSPGGAVYVTGDPGAKFRSVFFRSVTGDILGRMPTWAKSKGEMLAGVSL